jgi:hypothetical protein
MNDRILQELRAMAARLPCSSAYAGAPACGTTTCEKARLEALEYALRTGMDMSAARSAASAAYVLMADVLIELLEASPGPTETPL